MDLSSDLDTVQLKVYDLLEEQNLNIGDIWNSLHSSRQCTSSAQNIEMSGTNALDHPSKRWRTVTDQLRGKVLMDQ